VHGHRDVLDAVVRAHAEMPVVTRAGAEELDLALLTPRLVAPDAMRVGVAYEVVHEVEARRAVDHHVRGVDAHDLCREGTGGGKPVRRTVVADGKSAIVKWGGGVDEVKHGARKRDLLGARLSASHVELEVKSPQALGLVLEGDDGGV